MEAQHSIHTANRVVSVQFFGYHGWLLEQFNTSSFRDQLKELLNSQFVSQIPLAIAHDREIYRLRIHRLPKNIKDLKNVQSSDNIYLKRYRTATTKQSIQSLLYVHKAQKAWRIGRKLIKKGIQTPLPIAYLSRRLSFRRIEHLLVTQAITHGMSLQEYVQKYIRVSPTASQNKQTVVEKRRLIQDIASFLGELHAAGIYHGDLTADNIFINRTEAPGTLKRVEHIEPDQFQVFLIDLDSIRSTFWISSRRRLKNLDELGRNFLDLRLFSTTDRARFLKHYLSIYTEESRTFKHLFREIFQRTQIQLKKHHGHFIRSV